MRHGARNVYNSWVNTGAGVLLTWVNNADKG